MKTELELAKEEYRNADAEYRQACVEYQHAFASWEKAYIEYQRSDANKCKCPIFIQKRECAYVILKRASEEFRRARFSQDDARQVKEKAWDKLKRVWIRIRST
jgi:hypothetical protein